VATAAAGAGAAFVLATRRGRSLHAG
jgi:hypothetical protein